MAAGRAGRDDRATTVADEVAALGRRLFWDPRGPVGFYPQWTITLGDPPKLSWSGKADDPDDPARLVNRLEGTSLGCAWVLDRWAELREVLEAGHRWQPPDRFRAIRLLGRQPLEAGEDERVLGVYLGCAAMAPGTIQFLDVATELDHAERKRFMERLDEREVMRGPPPDENAGRERLLAIVGAEEERLEELLAIRLERGDADDLLSAFDASDAGERLRRYQATCDRALVRVLEAMRKRHRDTLAPAAGRRKPERPAPEPPTDPSRRIEALLRLLEVARGGGAANDPMTSPLSQRPEPAPAVVDEPTRPAEPRPAPVIPAPQPAAEHARTTNEANATRRNAAWPVAIVVMIAMALGAGSSAAFAAASPQPPAGRRPSNPSRSEQALPLDIRTSSSAPFPAFPWNGAVL